MHSDPAYLIGYIIGRIVGPLLLSCLGVFVYEKVKKKRIEKKILKILGIAALLFVLSAIGNMVGGA